MIAAATIYDVSTQVIVSCEASRSPVIDGSATLAIVVSSTCMIVASMIETVIRPRCGTLCPGSSVVLIGVLSRRFPTLRPWRC
jgi:hypothetical protein